MALTEKCLLMPVRFGTANPVIRMTANIAATPTATDVTIVLSADTDYWVAGDDDTTANHADLLKIIEDEINSEGFDDTFEITVDSRNIVTVQSNGAAFVINWSHANTTFDAEILGFLNTADTASGTIAAGPDCSQGFWYPGTATNARAPLDDSRKEPVGVAVITETASGASRGYDISPGSGTDGERFIQYYHIDKSKVLTEFAAADEPYGSAEYNWVNYWRKGVPIRVYEDKATRVISGWELFRMQPGGRPWSFMDGVRIRRYNVDFALREVAT